MQRRGAERRRFVRVAEEVVVSVTPACGASAGDGRTLNFSAGGVLLVLSSAPQVGSEVQVVLRMEEDDRLLAFAARVLRVRTLSDRSHEVAAEFVGGSAGDQRALGDLIAARLPAGLYGAPQPA